MRSDDNKESYKREENKPSTRRMETRSSTALMKTHDAGVQVDIPVEININNIVNAYLLNQIMINQKKRNLVELKTGLQQKMSKKAKPTRQTRQTKAIKDDEYLPSESDEEEYLPSESDEDETEAETESEMESETESEDNESEEAEAEAEAEDTESEEESEDEDDKKNKKKVRPPKDTILNPKARFYSEEERHFYKGLPDLERKTLADKEIHVESMRSMRAIPLRFKVLNSDMSDAHKVHIMQKLDFLDNMDESNSEFYKLHSYVDRMSALPIGKYKNIPVSFQDPPAVIGNFLQETKDHLNKTIFGQEDVKNQIMRILAQWIVKPLSKGNVIGIQGPAGVGKTELVKRGICQALKLPFGFIGLGGGGDASFLEGHAYTYEGAMPGRIAEVVSQAGVMNPILFFDELDKVSETAKGEELSGLLTHITDSTQNEHFQDKYFGGVDLDLSKCLFIFTFNDESKINPILRDRMIMIHVPGYSKAEKLTIAKTHLLPNQLQEFGFSDTDIIFPDEVMRHIINAEASIDHEKTGVRKLKRKLERIMGHINLERLFPSTKSPITLPLTLCEKQVDAILKDLHADPGAIDNTSLHMLYM